MMELKMQKLPSRIRETGMAMMTILTKTRKLSLAIKSVATRQFMKNCPQQLTLTMVSLDMIVNQRNII
jgi:hypothetical protein